jgi:Sister chromatid cohesion protein Dcc1
MITSATAEDMPLGALQLDDCVRSLQDHGISREIMRHCLRSFSEACDSEKMDEEMDKERGDNGGVCDVLTVLTSVR